MQPPQRTDLVPHTGSTASTQETTIPALTAQIIAAHVANNRVSANDLPNLIRAVYTSLVNASRSLSHEALIPAVPIKQSLSSDQLVCLECGRKFATIKRHLKTSHQMTVNQYRDKWQLPASYPMVTSAYSKVRTRLAKKLGLGHIPKSPRRRTAK